MSEREYIMEAQGTALTARVAELEAKIGRLRVAWKRDREKGDAWFSELTKARATLEAVRELFDEFSLDDYTDGRPAPLGSNERYIRNIAVALQEILNPTPAPGWTDQPPTEPER